jgi:hypothetical protein
MYIFHLDRLRKSMVSCSLSSHCICVRRKTTFAIVHYTARLRVGGHILKWGLRRHLLGILRGIVWSINASFCLISFHISSPSPHSVSRCRSVSCLSQWRHLSVGAMHILCSLLFVDRMSFITLYHAAFISPGTGVSARFFHTEDQSVLGHIVIILISHGPVSILLM